MSAPFFSVIIPSYNRAQLLRTTLESVFSQDFVDFEVIVVDDGSDDATTEVMKDFGDKIRFLCQRRRGPGAARNLGLSCAQGCYAAFLDSDDLWFPWSLQVYSEVIQTARHPAFVAGKPCRFSIAEDLIGQRNGLITIESFPDYLASGEKWRWWGVSSFVIRVDVLRLTSGFADLNINGEDGDLALKLGVARGFAQVTSPSTFGYREHVGNLTADIRKTVAGTRHKIESEQSQLYPGGKDRECERWEIITRHVRPVALSCLQHGMFKDAWKLYRATFYWHLRLRRWKYLVGFPGLAMWSRLRRRR